MALAQRGSVYAKVAIGWMHETGAGLARDQERARNHYLDAAKSGHPLAQFYLGLLSRRAGRYEEAYAWFRDAATQAYAPALYRLGWAYHAGEGVDRDLSRAADCFRQASRQGHIFGMREVALRMLRGREGLASIPNGLYLYIKAMVSGVVLAARNPKSERLLG
ncbi:MAG: tetratricopeptide repeat protein [Candidatus Rokuibacteriota bacterium]